MSAHTPEAIQRQKIIYRGVAAALIVGTIVTVLAASVHLGIIVGIIVALIIATVKGSLVAGYFMHLFSEKRLIYTVLALTAVFIVAMVGLLLFSYGDQQGHPHGIFQVPQQHVQPHHEAAAAAARKGGTCPLKPFTSFSSRSPSCSAWGLGRGVSAPTLPAGNRCTLLLAAFRSFLPPPWLSMKSSFSAN